MRNEELGMENPFPPTSDCGYRISEFGMPTALPLWWAGGMELKTQNSKLKTDVSALALYSSLFTSCSVTETT